MRSTSKRSRIDLDQFEDYEATPKKRSKTEPERMDKIAKKLKKTFQKLSDEDENDYSDVKSVFEEAFAELKKTLSSDNADISLDMTTPAFLRSSLLMLTEMIPIAERAFKKKPSQSTAYAVSALINQVREINTDLKIGEDIESKAINLKRIVDTTMRGVAQMFLDEKYELNNRLGRLTHDERINRASRKEVDKMLLSFSKGLQEHSALLGDRIRAYLMGVPGYMSPNEKQEPKKKRPRKSREQ